MNGQEFTDTVRTAHETPLSRLGSSKWVYALTDGEMTGDAVQTAWAADARAARETFDAWAADADDPARAAFAEVAETVGAHAAAAAEPRPTYEALRSLDDTAARAGGLLAWTLVAEKTLAQMVGFFVGDADPGTANTFRDHRTEIQALRETAEALLDELALDDADWDRAREGADRVVEAAYDDYVETLESMGVKPKNVC
jgi:hypothetical protein